MISASEVLMKPHFFSRCKHTQFISIHKILKFISCSFYSNFAVGGKNRHRNGSCICRSGLVVVERLVGLLQEPGAKASENGWNVKITFFSEQVFLNTWGQLTFIQWPQNLGHTHNVDRSVSYLKGQASCAQDYVKENRKQNLFFC